MAKTMRDGGLAELEVLTLRGARGRGLHKILVGSIAFARFLQGQNC